LLAAYAVVGCGNIVEDIIQDPPMSLAESDLPNCSRVINCCSRLGQGLYGAVLPESVSSSCTDSVGVAADTAIEQYQVSQQQIDNQTGITEANRAELQSELTENWQNAVEPGCRCFLEQTVGTVPDLVIPSDCESYSTTGTLVGGATCDDGISALIDTAASGINNN